MSKVPLSELRPRVDPASFSFETTAEVPPHVGLIGQDRAIEAIKFGLAIESRGFNICVAGEPGTGRTTAIREYLELHSMGKPPSSEFLYVNNFQEPHEPRALSCPPARGSSSPTRWAAMIEEAKTRIPQAFASEDFVNRRDEIIGAVQRQRDGVFSALAEQARQEGFSLQGNQTGFFLVPLAGDQPMDEQAFAALPEEQRQELTKRRDELMEELREATRQEQGVEVEANSRLGELQKMLATSVVDSLVEPLIAEFSAFPAVVAYLTDVRQDMIEHIADFRPQEQQQPAPTDTLAGARPPSHPLRKYEVNLLIDCSREQCAKVVFESNPSPQRLFGRIEKEAIFGALTTDFTMIRPGSMHRANGGYLVFDFDDMLQYPLSWNELKRTIRTGLLTIEEMGDRLGYLETKTVRPQPIPWRGKIVAHRPRVGLPGALQRRPGLPRAVQGQGRLRHAASTARPRTSAPTRASSRQ